MTSGQMMTTLKSITGIDWLKCGADFDYRFQETGGPPEIVSRQCESRSFHVAERKTKDLDGQRLMWEMRCAECGAGHALP